ncbi:MAG: lamin tail domain-containing protein [Salinivenus sp.]
MAFPDTAVGQISLSSDGTTVTRNFDSFDGDGFSPDPSDGQLDSDEFIATGLSDGDLSFGGEETSGSFAQGVDEGGVISGGIYAFETDADDFSLGVQPTGDDFTPGTFVAQYKNETGGTITEVDLSYDIEVYNDADRSSSVTSAYATGACGSTPGDEAFSALSDLDVETPEAKDDSPSWETTERSTTVSSLALPEDDCLFLRFTSDDGSGSGSRDELALDDLSVEPKLEPTVQFTTNSGTVNESSESTTLTAEIANPDGNEVTVDVVFDEGSSDASQSDFTSTFPASETSTSLTFGTNASDGDTETVPLDFETDDGAEGEESAAFDLENITTDGEATLGTPTTFDLTIQDAVSEHEGDVLITELMPAPSVNDTDGEYIELYNATSSGINLNGWTIDPPGTGDTDIDEDLEIPPRGFAVLCRNTDVSENGGIETCDFPQDGGLTNSGGEVEVRDDGDAVVDIVDYSDSSPWPDANDAAMVFTGTAENNDGDNWAEASRRERGFTQDGSGSGDPGSPGRNGTGQALQPTAEVTSGAGWRMLAAPMGGVNADTLAAVSLVQGVDGHFPNATPNLYQWPGGPDDSSTDWTVPSSRTTDLTSNGQGFIWYVFDTAETPQTDPPPFTIGLPGTPRTSDVTTGSLDEGFHLLGNPYAQSFDLSGLDLGDQNFQTTAQLWDPSEGTYETVTQSSTSDDLLGPYQGFFVECVSDNNCAGNTLTFSESGRRADPAEIQNQETEAPPRIEFRLVGRDAAGTTLTRDEALLLHAPEGGTTGWDVHDASKLTPLSDRYATAAFQDTANGEMRLQSVASVPPTLPEEGVDLPLSLQVQDADSVDTFELEWHTWEHVPDQWGLTLHDTVTDSTVNLRRDTSYAFSLSPSAASSTASAGPSTAAPPPIRAQAQSDSARFTLTVQPTPIPVELTHFEATAAGRTARLSWTTASESNNAGFHIEHRGPEREAFASIGFVDGHGTTDTPRHYRFRTDSLDSGRHVFRLRQVDLDGSVTRSDTVAVQMRLADDAEVTLAPNPIRETGTVSIQVREPQTVEVALYDLLGRRVRTLHRGRLSAQQSHALPIRAGGLSSGSYLLRAEGEHFRTTRRVTIVR